MITSGHVVTRLSKLNLMCVIISVLGIDTLFNVKFENLENLLIIIP